VSHRPTVGRHLHDDAENEDVTVTDETLTGRLEASRPRWLTTITSRVCLDMLRAAERLAFVMHDLFAVHIDEVAAILHVACA
jgi:DNA-directed RNA polymerase specialized sigma24 family protein